MKTQKQPKHFVTKSEQTLSRLGVNDHEYSALATEKIGLWPEEDFHRSRFMTEEYGDSFVSVGTNKGSATPPPTVKEGPEQKLQKLTYPFLGLASSLASLIEVAKSNTGNIPLRLLEMTETEVVGISGISILAVSSGLTLLREIKRLLK